MNSYLFGIQIGSVKWYNKEKGFGFIQPSDGSEDLFFHSSKIRNNENGNISFDKGQKVEYTVGQNRKGPQAEDVTLKGSGNRRTTSQKRYNPNINFNRKTTSNDSFINFNR